MEVNDNLLKEILESHLQDTLSRILPATIKKVISNNQLFIGQDFISINEAIQRYRLSRRTIYNYHSKGYITLHTSEGKTFISVRDLEGHIKRNPLHFYTSDLIESHTIEIHCIG